MEYKERLLLNALEIALSLQRTLMEALREYMDTSAKDIGYAEPGTETALFKELKKRAEITPLKGEEAPPWKGAGVIPAIPVGEVWPRPTVFTSVNQGQSWDVEKAAQAAADERAPIDLTFPIKF